jgi:PAS domain S-box-containing protein
METMFGYSRSELIGQTVEMLLPERFRRVHPAHREGYRAHAEMRPMGVGLDLYGRRKDGSEIPVDIMLSSIQVAQGPLVLSAIRDVTGQKKIQEALHQTQQRFGLLIENARDHAIFLMDISGSVVTWNPGAERLKGYRAEEIIGRSFSCFYTPEDVQRGEPERALHIAGADGRFESEGWRVRKDGSRFWANAVITRVNDSQGNLIAFAKITRDFTERRKAQRNTKTASASGHAKCSTNLNARIALALSCWAGRTIMIPASITASWKNSRSAGILIFSQNTLPMDEDLLERLFGDEVRAGAIGHPLEISDVWKNSYSCGTNHELWAAKFTARHPNLVALQVSSFKCGHDAPIYGAIEGIIEESGTPFFCFKDLDENKPAGSIKIRIETIDYFLRRYREQMSDRWKAEREIEAQLVRYERQMYQRTAQDVCSRVDKLARGATGAAMEIWG